MSSLNSTRELNNMSLQGLYQYFQAEALTALFIIAIIYILVTFVWKRAYVSGFIGLIVIGFAGVVIAGPEQLINVGQWFADLVSWG